MKKPYFLSVSMNPTLQKTLIFPDLVQDTVNRTSEYRLDTAGKGLNVCRVLTQLGRDACLLSQLGGALRPIYLDLCEQDNLRVEWVESSSPIRLCYTLIDRSKKSITELVEEAEKVGEGTEVRLMEKYIKLVQECSTLIISGTKAAGFSDALIPEMVRLAKAEGCRVILDVKGSDLVNSLPFQPDIIKPNLYEFVSTFIPEKISHNNIADPNVKEKVEKIWSGLYKKCPCTIVLTNGAASVLYSEKDKLNEYTIIPVDPVNTIGSGDAFTAGLASVLEDGAALLDAIAEGAHCGALNAGQLKPGVIL